MKTAKQWVDENSQSGAFDCISYSSGEALVEAIQNDARHGAKFIELEPGQFINLHFVTTVEYNGKHKNGYVSVANGTKGFFPTADNTMKLIKALKLPIPAETATTGSGATVEQQDDGHRSPPQNT